MIVSLLPGLLYEPLFVKFPDRLILAPLGVKIVPLPTVIFPFTVASVLKDSPGAFVLFSVRLGNTLVGPDVTPSTKLWLAGVELFPNWTVPPLMLVVAAIFR